MRRFALLAGLLACGCSSLGSRPAETVRWTRAEGRADVLRVSWRRLLTEAPLIEYKPQEFASAATDGTHVFVGSKGGFFWALRPGDGTEAWKKKIPGGVSSRPLYLPDTRTVFVGG